MDELLAAIFAAPDDDAVRLVYADALLERGDPRGELIQLQVARVTTPLPWDAPASKRERGLLAKHEKAWLAPIRPYIRRWHWSRGFVHGIEADSAELLQGIDRVFETTPLVRLKLTKMKPALCERLAEQSSLRSLRELVLEQQKLGPKSAPLFRSPFLASVRELDLLSNPLLDEGAAILASAEHLGSLTALLMASTQITLEGLEAISRASFFPQLQKLSIGVPLGWSNRARGGFGPSAVDALERAPSLRLLSMIYCDLRDEGLEALAASPAFANLEEIHLEGNNFSERGLMSLARSPHLAKLRRLPSLLHHSQIDPNGPAAQALRERFGERVLDKG